MKQNFLSAGQLAGTAFAPRNPDEPGASLPLGRLYAARYGGEEIPLNYYGRAHLFCVAPSGAGKSQALAIPALLSWPHAVVVLDVKGELFAESASYRRGRLQQTIHRFDPTDPGTSRFNPLAFINRDPFQIEQSIKDIAEVIVPIAPEARDQFFARSARGVIELALHYLCWRQPDGAVKISNFLKTAYDAAEFRNALEEMANALPGEGALLDSTRHMAAAMKAQFYEPDGALTRTAQSVWAELSVHLAPLNTEQIRQATSDTDWQPEALRDGKTSVFITLPPNARGQYRAIMALVLNAHLNALLDRLPPPGAPSILLLLDEMPQLGHMRGIEQVIDLGRGYGLLLYGFAQRRRQIEESYGKPGDFLGTFEARLYMNPAPEDESAEILSKAIGEEERVAGQNIERVRVAPPDELCGHEYRDDIVILSRGARPARVHKSFVRENPELKNRLPECAATNPVAERSETSEDTALKQPEAVAQKSKSEPPSTVSPVHTKDDDPPLWKKLLRIP